MTRFRNACIFALVIVPFAVCRGLKAGTCWLAPRAGALLLVILAGIGLAGIGLVSWLSGQAKQGNCSRRLWTWSRPRLATAGVAAALLVTGPAILVVSACRAAA